MKVIIAGSRDIEDFEIVEKAIKDSGFEITEVVSGKAPGVDALGIYYAIRNHITLKEFPADWDRYGPAAGPIRNGEMADYADALIAVWDGESPGTKSMIKIATKKGLKVFVRNLKEQ